ncbi:hypothetical protein Lepto782_00990 [Leptospira interrogans serovar Canicola]|uniref:Uncharacterized protein n=1 Tax=Leptospira interrogans serovar Canicola TaxID=211880 RepID=A0AAP9W8R4_LEPIR|nr:hypothetical protein [Leptospira interrogans]EMN65805.1 hypothetical protein LEP1GSC098_2931 [Leptospira interrogans serovar Grippotyphosa str. UI 08434]QOI41024.1 hypothetical protein Lepto782_00990 [Leptospira interrogans serovar Canicola]UMQ58720.1 hypothetical protein FH585_02720 [Leptospira interrogans]UNE67215.1 hypothetical protein FH588_02725 [Leptospira interrogans]
MIDFANDSVQFGDLTLDPSDNDLLSDSNSVRIVLSEIREMFEMTVADDIDYPEIYSRQRIAQNSTEYDELSERIQDAERILKFHPIINPQSINIILDEERRLVVDFRLKTGESVKEILMN